MESCTNEEILEHDDIYEECINEGCTVEETMEYPPAIRDYVRRIAHYARSSAYKVHIENTKKDDGYKHLFRLPDWVGKWVNQEVDERKMWIGVSKTFGSSK